MSAPGRAIRNLLSNIAGPGFLDDGQTLGLINSRSRQEHQGQNHDEHLGNITPHRRPLSLPYARYRPQLVVKLFKITQKNWAICE